MAKNVDFLLAIDSIKDRIGNYTLIFDAYSVITSKNANKHPSLKKTGAKIQWGIDDPEELTKWGTEIQLIEEKYLTANEEIKKLTPLTRVMFNIADYFAIAKKAHRLLIYKVS